MLVRPDWDVQLWAIQLRQYDGLSSLSFYCWNTAERIPCAVRSAEHMKTRLVPNFRTLFYYDSDIPEVGNVLNVSKRLLSCNESYFGKTK